MGDLKKDLMELLGVDNVDKIFLKVKALKNSSDFLECLEAVGVDNWMGYSDALDMYEEEY